MAWPPPLPTTIPDDSTVQLSNHPDDHNKIRDALEELVARVDLSPIYCSVLTFGAAQNTGPSKIRVAWGATVGAFNTSWRDPSDPTTLLIPVDGTYRIECQIDFTNLAGGAVARVFVNVTGGGNVLEAINGSGTATGGGNLTVYGFTIQSLSAGNAVTVDAMSSDDGAITPLQSYLSVTRLGD